MSRTIGDILFGIGDDGRKRPVPETRTIGEWLFDGGKKAVEAADEAAAKNAKATPKKNVFDNARTRTGEARRGSVFNP
jgi:hypothetical protein